MRPTCETLLLRQASERDYAYARRVHHTAYRDMVIRQFGAWEEEVQDLFFDESWHSAAYELILVDGEPCGYCCIHEHESCLQLVEFAIDVSKQGRGIGSMFLAKFKQLAAAKGKRAQLNVMKSNTKAKALYERSGFSIYGENPSQFLLCAP